MPSYDYINSFSSHGTFDREYYDKDACGLSCQMLKKQELFPFSRADIVLDPPLVWGLCSITFRLFKRIYERNPWVGKKYCSLFSGSWNIPFMPLISVSSFSIAVIEHAVVCENCSSCTFNQHVTAAILQSTPAKCSHLPCPCHSWSYSG